MNFSFSSSTDGILNGERLNLKWAVPLQEVEVHDDTAFSTKNLMMSSSSRNKNFGSRSLERNSGTKELPLKYLHYTHLM